MVKILVSRRAEDSSNWIEGFQDNEWNEFLELENASFIESDNELFFITNQGKKIGYTKDYLDTRNSEIISYAAPGSTKITKYLNEPGIFEIESRTGHYFKVLVESDYIQTNVKIPYYKLQFTQREIQMLSQGFAQGFLPSYDSSETYYEKSPTGSVNLYFRYISVIQNQLNYYANNGTLARGDNYYEWIKIKNDFISAKKIDNISQADIEKLQKYNHRNFL